MKCPLAFREAPDCPTSAPSLPVVIQRMSWFKRTTTGLLLEMGLAIRFRLLDFPQALAA